MPTYDYECLGCKHTFELFQMMSAAPIKKCPECHQNKVKRLIGSGGGIIFKGSGFYQTDYKQKESNYSSGARSAENNVSKMDKKQGVKANKPDMSPKFSPEKKPSTEKKGKEISDKSGKNKK